MNQEEKRLKHYKYMQERVQCPCGTETARCNMSTHRKSKKHQLWEEENGKVELHREVENHLMNQKKRVLKR